MNIRPKILLSLAVLFLALCASRTLAATEKSQRAELQKYVEAEKYVLEQIAVGEVANLSKRFEADAQKRILPANFIESLLLNPKGAKIHRNGVVITGARIVGPLNLANTAIEHFVFLTNCEFDNVFFFQTVFAKGLTIDKAIFHGGVDFSYATVHEGLMSNDSKFLLKDEAANFECIKVTGPVSFANSTFAGPVNFKYAVISGAFQLNDAKFLCQDEDSKTACDETLVNFNTMKVDSGFFAKATTFERPVDLINLRINDNFEGEKATFKKSAHFSMTSIGRNLLLTGVKFGDAVNLRSARVAGVIEFGVESAPANQPDLTDATYLNIYPTKGLLERIKNSQSEYSAYTEFENCLQRNGDTALADEVFMAKKKYERKVNWGSWGPVAKAKSYISQTFQGFGRIPQRVLYWDFAFILVGAFIFRRQKMVLKKAAAKDHEECKPDTPDDCPPYNSFLYSLTLFAPTIDTQYTNNWQPAATHRTTRWYMTLQKWAGYVLVPLTIGIWTGIFK